MKVHFLTLAVLILFSLVACKKKKEDSSPEPNTSNKKEVRYEITGNYSGYLDVVYTNAGGTLTSIKVTSLPWSVEFVAENSVYSVGLGAGSEVGTHLGVPGQTATMKIYSGGKVVKTQSSTANEFGSIQMPAIAYSIY